MGSKPQIQYISIINTNYIVIENKLMRNLSQKSLKLKTVSAACRR